MLQYVIPAGVTWYAGIMAYQEKQEEEKNMILATGVFARGDARYYTRLEFPESRMVEGTPVPTTDSMIRNAFNALTLFTGAKCISVLKGILYDPTGIPDSNDVSVEHRLKVLIRFVGGDVKQIEIPAADVLPDLANLKMTLANFLWHPTTGAGIESILKVDAPPERKARGK